MSPPAPPFRGGFRGSALHQSFGHFAVKYGPSATHAVVAKVQPTWPGLIQPNAPAFGVLGARVYPYAFVGDTVRAMRDVVRKDEDTIVRELTHAGLDVLLGTMHRILVRWLVSPKSFLDRRQEVWDLYHDQGRLNVLELASNHYVIEDAEWANTDGVVCKVNLEGRVKMLEVMGLRGVTALREKCRAWGHPSCVTRFRWGEAEPEVTLRAR